MAEALGPCTRWVRSWEASPEGAPSAAVLGCPNYSPPCWGWVQVWMERRADRESSGLPEQKEMRCSCSLFLCLLTFTETRSSSCSATVT